jgi:hypothetical protein
VGLKVRRGRGRKNVDNGIRTEGIYRRGKEKKKSYLMTRGEVHVCSLVELDGLDNGCGEG